MLGAGDFAYLDEEPPVFLDPDEDARSRREGERHMLLLYVANILGEGNPLRTVELVARAAIKGQESVDADELSVRLYSSAGFVKGYCPQAERLCELGVLEVAEATPRRYRLADRDAVLEALTSRGVLLSPTTTTRGRRSGLAE